MRRWILLLLLSCSLCTAQLSVASAADFYNVISPDRRIEVTIETGPEFSYSVSVGGRQILGRSPVSMTLASGQVLGKPAEPTGSDMQSVDRLLRPVLKIKRAEIRDNYNERRVGFKERIFPDRSAHMMTALRIASPLLFRGTSPSR